MKIVLCLAAVCALAVGARAQVQPAHRDVAYAKAGGRDLLLDLYLPAGAGKKPPLVVWIHGGAWRAGSKNNTPARFLVARGFALASIGYRLSGEATFPAQIHDCKAAIRWLRASASQYGYDATRIGVWGASAGGHLVSLLGTSGGVKELEGDLGHPEQSSRVQAVVDFYGPSDLMQISRFPSSIKHDAPDSPESLLIGAPLLQNPDKANLASPVRFVSGDDPPFLIVHGDKDMTVPFNQSELLRDALSKAGVPVTFKALAGAGHGGPQFDAPEMRELIAAFFEKHLGAR